MGKTARIFCVCFLLSACNPAVRRQPGAMPADGTHRGVYIFETEPYKAVADLEIKGGKITAVQWVIMDTMRNVPFDSTYGRYMEGNALYVDQCKKDWQGSRGYAPRLIQTQDINRVDAVTGATWTHMLFKKAVQDALR